MKSLSFLSLVSSFLFLVRALQPFCRVKVQPFRCRRQQYASHLFSERPDGELFDAGEFEQIIKKIGSFPKGKDSKDVDSIINSIREDQEVIHRKYPFESVGLPILPDCNNYYSGELDQNFWHQNADHVYVFVPIDDSVIKSDIDVNFGATSVEVAVKSKKVLSFSCKHRIIPDGSFWILEKNNDGKRHLMLDMEKRFRMINWNSLFSETSEVMAKESEEREKADLLQKLFAANKGMEKLTGAPAESIEEMMRDEKLMASLSDIDGDNQIYADGEGDDGSEVVRNFKIGTDDGEELSIDDLEIPDSSST